MKSALATLGIVLLAATLAGCGSSLPGGVPHVAPSQLEHTPDLRGAGPAVPISGSTAPARDREPETAPAPEYLSVPLLISNASSQGRSNEPVTAGLPLPKHLALTDTARLALEDVEGNPVPAQFTPLARWGGAPDDPSRPLRWLLIDFQASVPAWGEAVYHLKEADHGVQPTFPLDVTASPGYLTVEVRSAEAEPVRYSLSRTDGELSALDIGGSLTGRVRSNGVEYTSGGPVEIEVVLDGPMRTSIEVRGSYRDAAGKALLDYTSRYWFYSEQPMVRLFHTVENNTPCPLGEYEQISCADIGSEGSVSFSDLSLNLSTTLGNRLAFEAGGQGAVVAGVLSGAVLLVQDSSGTDHWDHYRTLSDWDDKPLDARPRLQAYVTFRGYRITLGGQLVDEGDQAPGWITISGESGQWTAGVRGLWQNYPKALRASPDGTIEIGLFPGEYGPDDYVFTLRAGEHKTHEILLAPDGGILPAEPLFAQAPPSWYVGSGAFPLTALPNEVDWPEHEDYLRSQLETAPAYEEWMDWYPNLYAALEGTAFYGIYDWGDWPLDYEGYGVAPLNPKYHHLLGLWMQWARSGDGRWFALAEAGCRHVADIDVLHTLHSPRHWSDGTVFGHSYHDEAGFLNPHRNEGGLTPDTAWGVDGLLLAYYLTGYEKAYDSALEVTDCIEYRLRNDVHLCTAFPECSGEGWALEDSLLDDGSRPAANSLAIAVAGYRATADPRYLAVADAVVDWASPELQPYFGESSEPGSDDARFAKPWQLNLYLRALAGYLEMRTEFGMSDWHHGGRAYLFYVDWLRDHVWLDLEPIDTGSRASYPYQWWLDGRQGDPTDEWATGNNVPDVSNWLLLGADVMAYAYRLRGESDYLERAASLFRTGTHDPWYEGDANTYSATKETVNSIVFGHVFLHEWAHR